MADDDVDDQYLVRRAIEDIQIKHVLTTVNNGNQLLEHLQKQQNEKTLPDCILLDLNMPLLDGFQALSRIKADKSFSVIPVFILSTSRSSSDRELSLKLGAADFFVKPTQFGDLKTIMKDICLRAHAISGSAQYTPS